MKKLSVELVQTEAQFKTAVDVRRKAYIRDGKLSQTSQFKSSLDEKSSIYIVNLDSKAVATFSIHKNEESSNNLEVFSLVKNKLKNKDNLEAIYVHSLGVIKEHRSAKVLKFIFSEIFKYLVNHNKKYIVISSDRRLKSKYEWIGFKSIDTLIQSHYANSGLLNIMYTRQERLGIYGLHADPLRWNIFLRDATRQLMNEGKLPNSLAYKVLFHFYSFFKKPALLIERTSRLFLKSKKSKQAYQIQRIRNV